MKEELREIKNILKKKPYMDVDYWKETARMLGDQFLEGYTLEQLQEFKKELDITLSGVAVNPKKSSRDDVPDWVDLDMRYWPKEELSRYQSHSLEADKKDD